jgi:hypothetical protein
VKYMRESDPLQAVFENPEKFGCAPLGAALLDGGIKAPGGWQAGKRAVLSLFSGFAEVNFDHISAGGRMLPTLDVYLDRMLPAAQSIVPDAAGAVGGSGYGFRLVPHAEEEAAVSVGAASDRKLLLAGTSSLVGHLCQAGMVLPQTVQALLDAGFCGEEFFWGFSSLPIVLRRLDAGETPLQEQVQKAGRLASLWLRGSDEELKAYLENWRGPGELRLHNLLSGNTFIGGRLDEPALTRCLL